MKKLILLVLLILLVGCQQQDISVVLNPGYDIIGINEEWIDEGCTLDINDDFTIDMEVSSNNLDVTKSGEYNIVYFEEYGGNEYTCLRIVKVIDETGPVVTLNPGIDTIIVGEEWIDASITVEGSNNDIVVMGTVDSNTAGSYEIIYIVTDDTMDVTIITRIINVIE